MAALEPRTENLVEMGNTEDDGSWSCCVTPTCVADVFATTRNSAGLREGQYAHLSFIPFVNNKTE